MKKKISILLFVLLSFFTFSIKSKAISETFDVYVNNNQLKTNAKMFVPQTSNISLTIYDSPGAQINADMPQYGYVALCSAFGSYDNRYISTVSSNILTNLNVINSTVGCTIPGTSDYRSTARVVYFTFEYPFKYYNFGSGNTQYIFFATNPTFAWYQVASNEYSLISVGFSYTPFNFNDTTDPSILQNDILISQGQQTIDSINDMKQKLTDKLQNMIISNNQKADEAEQTRKGILGKLGDVFTGIIELPKKLVDLLIEGLKNLFVPTDEQLQEIIDDSTDLSEDFGFVGESTSFFIKNFTSFLGMVNHNGCATLPEFTIGSTSLFESHTFWQQQQVCLNDNKILHDNIDQIRTITSIAFVCMFITFASRQFFNILSKETKDMNGDDT